MQLASVPKLLTCSEHLPVGRLEKFEGEPQTVCDHSLLAWNIQAAKERVSIILDQRPDSA